MIAGCGCCCSQCGRTSRMGRAWRGCRAGAPCGILPWLAAEPTRPGFPYPLGSRIRPWRVIVCVCRTVAGRLALQMEIADPLPSCMFWLVRASLGASLHWSRGGLLSAFSGAFLPVPRFTRVVATSSLRSPVHSSCAAAPTSSYCLLTTSAQRSTSMTSFRC